jgi:hypothetical protein
MGVFESGWLYSHHKRHTAQSINRHRSSGGMHHKPLLSIAAKLFHLEQNGGEAQKRGHFCRTSTHKLSFMTAK